MFPYYGSKSRIVKYYPKPRYNSIIEPFGGSASYSLLYYDKHITINEINPILYDIWSWLIQSATAKEILDNRDFYLGQDISNLNISAPHKNLIGFCINRGSVIPCKIVTKWSCQVKSRPDWASTTHYRLTQIANMLPKIRHWKITNLDYLQLDNTESTWFIDPPYQNGGHLYTYSNIDYAVLSSWALTRLGQIIVCENNLATWLPFQHIANSNGQKGVYEEVVYTN